MSESLVLPKVFIDGTAEIVCLHAQTGTIRNLEYVSADKLKKLIEDILFPLVRERHKFLLKEKSMPHLRFRKEADNVVSEC